MEIHSMGGNVFLLFVLFGVCECKLTTAMIKDSTSPKPYHGMTNGDAYLTDQVDGLQGRRRMNKTRSGSQIWDWDTWCLLQPRAGNCDQNIHRFYYNRQLDKCLPFVYSGCNSNENNFENKLDCELRCADITSTMNSYAVNQELLCQYQADVGACLAFETKYYYDVNSNTCSKFVYGGCAGNANRFDTKFHCTTACEGQ